MVRRMPRHAALSPRERRSLRRIEDSAALEDPLLELRLGLPRPLGARTRATIRRKCKTLWRRFAPHTVALLGMSVSTVLALVCFSFEFVILAMALSMSSGFALGWIIAEMRGSRRRDVPRKTYPSEQQPQS